MEVNHCHQRCLGRRHGDEEPNQRMQFVNALPSCMKRRGVKGDCMDTAVILQETDAIEGRNSPQAQEIGPRELAIRVGDSWKGAEQDRKLHKLRRRFNDGISPD